MGCPDVYYTRSLQLFCGVMNYEKNTTKALEFKTCRYNDVLEKEVERLRETEDIKRFIFNAGRVYECVIGEADRNGCDSFNAVICGTDKFVDLIFQIEHE